MASSFPHMPAPCSDCPFRKDSLKGWLGSQRMADILAAGSFVCHKHNELQCAGHMIIKGEDNLFIKAAQILDVNLNLKGQRLVFKLQDDCIWHHSHNHDSYVDYTKKLYRKRLEKEDDSSI